MANNAKAPYVPVPLELLAGLYTEASPESLPLGASPLVINCDFILGGVFQRPGKQNQFYFTNSFSEKVTNSAQSIPGPFDPHEVPWVNPQNAEVDSPGTYAVAQLNTSIATQDGILSFDKSSTGSSGGAINSAVATDPATPASLNSWEFAAYGFGYAFISNGIVFDPPWNDVADLALMGSIFEHTNLTGAASAFTGTLNTPARWSAVQLLFNLAGTSSPAIVQQKRSSSSPVTLPQPTTDGNTVLIVLFSNVNAPVGASFTDNQLNTYEVVERASGAGFTNSTDMTIARLVNCPAGITSISYSFSQNPADIYIIEYQGGILAPPTENISQILETQNYPFSINDQVKVLGFTVEISGKQTSLADDCILTVSLKNPAADSPTYTTQLGVADGTVSVATPLSNWGLTLTNDLFNDPNFGVNVVASALDGTPVTFSISAVKIKVWLTPDPAPNFNYMKTFNETGGEILTLVLGSDGVFYQEDVINAPGALTPVYDQVEPDTFAFSCTFDDREFIALSNLKNGTDIPYTYTPPNFDRLSQVGPGTPPSVSSNSGGSTIVSITQPTPKGDPEFPNHLSGLLWSSGPGNTSPGNVLTVYYARVSVQPVADPDLVVGVGVSIEGADTANPNNQFNGQPVDGNYTVTSVGSGVPPGGEFARWFFTVQMPSTQAVNQSQHEEGHGPDGEYQVTTATLTTAAQVPNLEVGNTMQISGTGGAPPAGYDGGFQVTATPNAAQMQITSTQLAGNVATYGFNLITGTTPAVGQIVTISGTLNGNGVFNLSNGVIASTSPGTFSIDLFGADVSSASENGAAIIFGTIFQFEPGQPVGNRSGGTLVTSGVIASGIRKLCYSFLTRNGFMTQPSPIATADITAGASGLVVSNLKTGPSNVIARIIHSTAANGGNFYNIPQPVTVVDNGQNVVNSSTWVRDNTSTTVTLSFSDGVLLAADQIDIQGNNRFECFELGSCVAIVPFAERLAIIGEQNKVFNFLNMSFDGGISGGDGSNAKYPAGWTTVGDGSDVIDSPIFGFAYQIANATGSPQATYGMITQGAYQDEFLTPIIGASTTYSARITASCPSGAASGNLVLDLFSPSLGRVLGSFSIPLASMDTFQQIFTGTMLTTSLAPVPTDLIIRLYAQNIPNGVTVTIDRVEPFPTEAPNNNTQMILSYKGDFESFDRLTGVVKCDQQNQQPVLSAFTLFGQLYPVKSGSMLGVVENQSTEPAYWNIPRVVSNSVGTVGPYAVTSGIDEASAGEEWAIIGSLLGLFIFNGSQPVKLSEEIQSLWNKIFWKNKEKMWIKNDVNERRILIGCPMIAPNQWLPTGIVTTDATPADCNIVLELNYKQLNTAGALMESVVIHRSYSGKLIASDIVRKWSVWSIKAPCGAFLERQDGTEPFFVGNSDHNGKIFELVDGLLEDDGTAIDQIYATAGFVPSETGQGMQMGVTRYYCSTMTLVIDGSGDVAITVYPDDLYTPYPAPLKPDITLPMTLSGDGEVPVDQTGNRLYVIFESNAVGAGYNLSRLVMMMRSEPWAPMRGRNL